MEKRNKQKRKKSRILMFMIGMSMMLFSCVGKEAGTGVVDEGSHVPGEEYVYVPEFYTIENEELGGFGIREAQFYNGRMYYRCTTDVIVGWWYENIFEYRDMNDLGTAQSWQFLFEKEGYDTNVSFFAIDDEGNVYIIWDSYPMCIEGEEYNYEA